MNLKTAQMLSRNGVAIFPDLHASKATGWAWNRDAVGPYRTFLHPRLGEEVPRWRINPSPVSISKRIERKLKSLLRLNGWIPADPLSPLEALAAQAE